ncbi:MAG: DUF2007 domain-containing protein [Gammaproteobacteria bacterium]|nr:DUF2007 domain-containing protein [Gammaproteobacteria bacterium]
MTNLVVIATFSFPLEAQIARTSLESAGIEVLVADEHTINMDWLYSNAMGGVRLLVESEDVDEARRVLGTDFSQDVDENFLVNEKNATDVIHCRRCGSDQVYAFTKGEPPTFLTFMLLGLPLVFYKHGQKCKDCGAFWY